MGVTYKLKDEIVEFIIRQKRDNPRLSCRGLVDIIQERFQTPVSKSSINSVIKNASLSNPVGRTPLGDKKPRKYKIPTEKKNLFNAKPLASSPAGLPQSQFEAPAPVSTSAPRSKVKSPIVKAQKANTDAVEGKLSGKTLYDGMGSIFLKAAEWEIAEKSILGNLLQDNTKGDQLTDLDTGFDVLLYLELFGIKSLDELSSYKKSGLWALNGLENRLHPASLAKILQEVRDLKKLSLKISYEIPQIFAHLQTIRLVLEDGTAIHMDAELTSLWPHANLACPAYASLNQTIALVSKQLLNNTQPMIFCSAPGATSFAQEFYEMLMAFENLPGKRIKTISVFDIQQQEIAQFDTAPHQKRNFIAGVWPWQKEFDQLISTETTGEKVTNAPPFKSKIYYEEVVAPFAENENNPLLSKLRAVVLRESPGAAPYLALLTNIKPDAWPASEIVSAYISKWPNEIKTPHLHFVTEQREEEAELIPKDFGHLESNLFTLVYGIPGIWEIIHSLLLALNIFCQRHFFPSGYGNMDLAMMKEHFYGLNGYLWEEDDFLYVKLLPPRNYLYQNDLEYAMRRVNEKGVCDPFGRRLIFQF